MPWILSLLENLRLITCKKKYLYGMNGVPHAIQCVTENQVSIEYGFGWNRFDDLKRIITIIIIEEPRIVASINSLLMGNNRKFVEIQQKKKKTAKLNYTRRLNLSVENPHRTNIDESHCVTLRNITTKTFNYC